MDSSFLVRDGTDNGSASHQVILSIGAQNIGKPSHHIQHARERAGMRELEPRIGADLPPVDIVMHDTRFRAVIGK